MVKDELPIPIHSISPLPYARLTLSGLMGSSLTAELFGITRRWIGAPFKPHHKAGNQHGQTQINNRRCHIKGKRLLCRLRRTRGLIHDVFKTDNRDQGRIFKQYQKQIAQTWQRNLPYLRQSNTIKGLKRTHPNRLRCFALPYWNLLNRHAKNFSRISTKSNGQCHDAAPKSANLDIVVIAELFEDAHQYDRATIIDKQYQ